MYQYAEYTYAQCLKRYTQSNITQKVNCLSGCNQILRICEETCGEKILKEFNRLPKNNENIFNHIRSYASEDRNHVSLMLSMYPYVKTVQNLDAIAYTNVPRSPSVFLSQRRRWNLGANSNDLMLTYLPGINIFERISSLNNVMTFGLTSFIFAATVYFIIAIVRSPSLLMLYLSIIMIIPFIYALSIPIFVKKQSYCYYYTSLILFYSLCGCINLITHLYSIFQMDTIKWGKTRSIQKNETDIKSTSSLEEKSNQNSDENNGYIVVDSTSEEKDSNDCTLKKINIENREDSDDLFYTENTIDTENTEEKDCDGSYSMNNTDISTENIEVYSSKETDV